MAWQDPQEIRIAASGEVYVAPVGTTLPTDSFGWRVLQTLATAPVV